MSEFSIECYVMEHEIDSVAAELIRRGEAPYIAAVHAAKIIQERRQREAITKNHLIC